jgi:glucose-6-phosphate 1-epimerase
MPLISITHPLFHATILTQGAQLIEWTPTGSDPVLWSSDISHFTNGKPFRGGIPICWPWFGKSRTPAHGFARILPWELIAREDRDEEVHLTFRLTDTHFTHELWNHPFTLTLQMKLGTTCEITLDIDAPIETTGALHTYVYTADITHASITGLGDHYIDSLQNALVCTAPITPLCINLAIDRIYTAPQSHSILTDTNRTLTVHHLGHSDVVVWNPWSQGTATITDMDDNDYRQMICIETARITQPLLPKNSLSLTLTSLNTNPVT